jgi:hypothetical protein
VQFKFCWFVYVAFLAVWQEFDELRSTIAPLDGLRSRHYQDQTSFFCSSHLSSYTGSRDERLDVRITSSPAS